MNFEQIMIRLGVDATAVKTGLGKVSSQVKAWGASMAHGMKEYTGGIMKGFLGAEAVTKAFEYLEHIKHKILEIAHISKATGANTNFIQSMMNEAEKDGVSFDKLSGGIARFNKALGAAKMGNMSALKSLHDMGVVTNLTSAKSLTFTQAIHNLAVSYDKLHDKQKQAYLLQQAFGKGYAEMIPLFERGAAAVDKMSEGSFFTKISSGSISDFETIWHSIKSGTQSTMATVVNLIDVPISGFRKLGMVWGEIFSGALPFTKKFADDMAEIQTEEEGINAEKALEAQADKDGISVAEEKLKILEQQKEMLQKQGELRDSIADRDKESVADMAARFEKLTGRKTELERFHTITPRMREAYKIKSLEDSAKVAFLKGDDKRSNKLQSEADQIRASSTYLKRSDVNPMQKTEAELEKINEQMENVNRAAELITGPQSGGAGGSW